MKRRTIVIILILIVVIGVGGFIVYQQQNNAKSGVAALQTATISRSSLVATVSGGGNIYAPQQANLNFQLTGVLINKVNVQVGDQVKAGDMLAQVDDTTLQYSLRNAQANLASAQAKLDALKNPSALDVNTARAQLASAQAAYNAAVAKNVHGPDQLASAKASLDNAQASLNQAQAAYDTIAWRTDVGSSSQALALEQATNTYKSALANYNLAVVDVNDSAVKSAAQSLAQANATYTQLVTPTQQNLEQTQASVDTAQIAVDQAQRNLDQAKIIAPFDGTISAVNYVVGQYAASSTAITLVNMSNLQTQITVAEVDIPKVKVGQAVSLSFDALGGKSVPGKILTIAPVGTITSGVVNYTVTVALTKPDPQILPGMTATANITVAQRDNVLTVPNLAVKTQGNRKVLTILFEGKQVPVIVQTGLNNDTTTEIISAADSTGQAVTLQDGDTVVLNPTTTTTTGGGNFRGNPLGGGLGGPVVRGGGD